MKMFDFITRFFKGEKQGTKALSSGELKIMTPYILGPSCEGGALTLFDEKFLPTGSVYCGEVFFVLERTKDWLKIIHGSNPIMGVTISCLSLDSLNYDFIEVASD